MGTKVVFCSDVHLCHLKFYGWQTEPRMQLLTDRLNALYEQGECGHIFFLGDCSLDHWAWQIRGSWLARGESCTERFVKEYLSQIKAPWDLLPGNHEQYGPEIWRRFTGRERTFVRVVGGWLVIGCDNFAGLLDPAEHSDGVYSPTDLAFVRAALDARPGLPAVLCAHWFDPGKEPEEFYDFLRRETRIALLVCGHDHLAEIAELGERAGGLCILHDGNWSAYTGSRRDRTSTLWGWAEAALTDGGVSVRYVEPPCAYTWKNGPFWTEGREQCVRFFPRRDL